MTEVAEVKETQKSKSDLEFTVEGGLQKIAWDEKRDVEILENTDKSYKARNPFLVRIREVTETQENINHYSAKTLEEAVYLANISLGVFDHQDNPSPEELAYRELAKQQQEYIQGRKTLDKGFGIK